MIHSLWECTLVKRFWKVTWLGCVRKCWKVPSFIDLFHRVAKASQGTELELFCLMAWWIWKDRNNVYHGKKGLEQGEMQEKVSMWLTHFSIAQESKQISNRDRFEVWTQCRRTFAGNHHPLHVLVKF